MTEYDLEKSLFAGEFFLIMAMPSHFAGLPRSLFDPARWTTTKFFENGTIWGEIQPFWAVHSHQEQSIEFQV